MSSYLRFYVPDPDYAAGRTADDYDRLLNSGSKGDFTGLAVYTSLDGFPVHAVRYAGGACQAEAFLYDKSRTQAENTARLGEMLDGLSVVCSRETAVTRAEAEAEKSEPVDGGGIEAIVVSAKHPVNHIKYERPDTDPVKPTEEDQGPSGSGGGGGGASSNPGSPANTRYRENENIMLASDSRKNWNRCWIRCARIAWPGRLSVQSGECNDPHRFFRKFGDDSDCLYFRRRCRMGRFRDQDGVSARRYHFARRAFPYAPMFGQNPEEYRGMRLNNEIEAKLCWYMYRLKIGNTTGFEKNLGGSEGRDAFNNLYECILSKDTGTERFNDAYRDAADVLRSMGGSYANVTRYPFSETAMQVDVLLSMIADCPEYKN